MKKSKYIFAREWGFGFWSDMDHILAVLMVAEITGRVPIVYWGNNSLFRNRDDDEGGNAFDYFWKSLNDTRAEDLSEKRLTFYPESLRGIKLTSDIPSNAKNRHVRSTGEEFLERNEDVIVSTRHFNLAGLIKNLPKNSVMSGKPVAEVYRTIWQNYLRPRQNIAARVQEFIQENLSGGPFVAVHARGSDKADEAGVDFEQLNDFYFDILDPVREKPEWRIFVLTESDILLNKFRNRYGDQVVSTDSYRTSGKVGIHHLREVSGKTLGEEVLIDTLISLQADRFIGNGLSNVSCAIDVFKKWLPGESGLVVANQWIEGSDP